MRTQGITQHREFDGCGRQQSFKQIINLGGINREQGEAGVQMLPTLIFMRGDRPGQPLRPAAVPRELVDDGGDVRCCARSQCLHQGRGPQCSISFDHCPGNEAHRDGDAQRPLAMKPTGALHHATLWLGPGPCFDSTRISAHSENEGRFLRSEVVFQMDARSASRRSTLPRRVLRSSRLNQSRTEWTR